MLLPDPMLSRTVSRGGYGLVAERCEPEGQQCARSLEAVVRVGVEVDAVAAAELP